MQLLLLFIQNINKNINKRIFRPNFPTNTLDVSRAVKWKNKINFFDKYYSVKNKFN